MGLCRKNEEAVDELCVENGPYKAIEFKDKYAKRPSVQYMVSMLVIASITVQCLGKGLSISLLMCL